MSDENFFTFRKYMKKDYYSLTASMEDYLEMIYRLSKDTGFLRIQDLAKGLNVQPPSATKMVQKLAKLKLVDYKKYAIIMLTSEGEDMGRTLLMRHNTIESFLKMLGIKEGILEETEKIEHTISNKTVECLDDFTKFIKMRPDVISDFNKFREENFSEM